MRIRLLCVGTRMPAWISEGYATFAKRLPRDQPLILDEVPAARRAGDVARCVDDEGSRMLARIGRDEHVVALDEHGTAWSSVELARRMNDWRRDGRDIVLLVGGSDGLAAACLARSQERWSLSRATLPHGLVRVVVAEQIYRAWTQLSGHPYHRA